MQPASMQEVRLNVPAEIECQRSVQMFDQYYTRAPSSISSQRSKSDSTSTNASLTGTKRHTTKRSKCLATTVGITLVAIAALVVTAFAFDFTKYASRVSSNVINTQFDSSTTEQSSTRASRLEHETSVEMNEIKDTVPSGFGQMIDFVPNEQHEGPVLGPAAPNVVAVVDQNALTPELERQLLEQLHERFPEAFSDGAASEQDNGHALPPGAAQFGFRPAPDFSNYGLKSNELGGFILHSKNNVVPPGPLPDENDEVDVLPPFDFPEPPRGAWENLATPPPPNDMPRIRFQETAPNVPWEGPSDATWFHQGIPIDGKPKEQRIAAPWLGDGCTIVTTTEGDQRVEDPNDKCDTVVWFPYHYDIYPNSKADDWVYIDMNEGKRSHIWPGAGPFRKIEIVEDPTTIGSGPICLDMPAAPADYQGVQPDELFCSGLLPRVSGYGDDKDFVRVTEDMDTSTIESAWAFAWRQI